MSIQSPNSEASIPLVSSPIVHELLLVKRHFRHQIILREANTYLFCFSYKASGLALLKFKQLKAAKGWPLIHQQVKNYNKNIEPTPPPTKTEILGSHYLSFPHIKPENPDV